MEEIHTAFLFLWYILGIYVMLMGLYALLMSRLLTIVTVEAAAVAITVKSGFLSKEAGCAVGLLVVGATTYVWACLKHPAKYGSSRK